MVSGIASGLLALVACVNPAIMRNPWQRKLLVLQHSGSDGGDRNKYL